MNSFAALAEKLRAWEASIPTVPGSWSFAQTIEHCAQSIEYSVSGYPRLRSGLFRATVGRIAKHRFLSKGAMSHDLSAPVPGAPALEMTDAKAAIARLERAITAFQAHDRPLAPHLAYGPCTKAEYEALHVMHVADHIR